MMKSRPKGISLPIETVILLILAAVVLAALLGFFTGVVTPAQLRAGIIQKQSSLCTQIVTADVNCNAEQISKNALPSVSGLPSKLMSDVCNKPSDSPICSGGSVQDCIRNCCRTFCPS